MNFPALTRLLAFLALSCVLLQQVLSQERPTLTCSTVLCITNTTCFQVIDSDGAEPKPACLNPEDIVPGANDICKDNNYARAVLRRRECSEPPYEALPCGSSCQPGQEKCPFGADCVTGSNGESVCCEGLQPPPVIKEGSCPANLSLCGGTFCQSDEECVDDDKCCSSDYCGGNLCTKPTCGSEPCQPDKVCVSRGVCCPPGQFCILIAKIFCVPRGCEQCGSCDTCADLKTGNGRSCYTQVAGSLCRTNPGRGRRRRRGCTRNQVCVDTGIRCITLPCDPYRCVTPLTSPVTFP